MTTITLFFNLLRYELCEEALTNETKEAINIDSFKNAYSLAKSHDLGHLIFDAVEKNKALPVATTNEDKEFLQKAKSSKDVAIMRDMTKEYEIGHIEDIFQKNKIQFIPLKGAFIRNYYPETWMRTSADIDILIHEEDIDNAVELLVLEGFETDGKKNHHDISLMLGDVHLELHFNACMDDGRENVFLPNVWDYSIQNDGYKYCLDKEFFVFYLIAHMAKHFYLGGSGVRTLIDLFIINNKLGYDEEKVLSMCKEVGLDKFYLASVKLSNIWLGTEQHDDTTKDMQDYILRSGIYGTNESNIVSTTIKNGGKSRAIWRYIFLPYKSLKIKYPVLEKHKLLTPFFQVVRWISAIFNGRARKAAKRIKKMETQSNDKIDNTKVLFDKLGLIN